MANNGEIYTYKGIECLMKSKRSNNEKTSLLVLSLAILSVVFSACSNKHAIKQSPCACYDIEVLQKNKG